MTFRNCRQLIPGAAPPEKGHSPQTIEKRPRWGKLHRTSGGTAERPKILKAMLELLTQGGVLEHAEPISLLVANVFGYRSMQVLIPPGN